MTSKRQRRAEEAKGRKKKKSTRILYFSIILGEYLLLLVFFFVILFNALFPPVDMDSLKKERKTNSHNIFFRSAGEVFNAGKALCD